MDDTVTALEILDADSESAEKVVAAKKLVADAKNSKQVNKLVLFSFCNNYFYFFYYDFITDAMA